MCPSSPSNAVAFWAALSLDGVGAAPSLLGHWHCEQGSSLCLAGKAQEKGWQGCG